MNISGISNSGLGFSGIYGTATKKDGTKVSIDLPQDKAFLEITNGKVKGTKKLSICIDSFEKKSFDDSNSDYQKVEIDRVDGNSSLAIQAFDDYKIGEMKDNASLDLGSKDGLSKEAWVTIHKIIGPNVKMNLCKNSQVSIKGKSEFELHSSNINKAKLSGEDIFVNG